GTPTAAPGNHHQSINRQARKVRREDAGTPRNGNAVLNVNVLEDRIEHYYGSASATYPKVGTVTIPSKHGAYAKQMRRITARSARLLKHKLAGYDGSGKPAVVFDIDDTLLNTYDYTLSAQFGYDPTENA